MPAKKTAAEKVAALESKIAKANAKKKVAPTAAPIVDSINAAEAAPNNQAAPAAQNQEKKPVTLTFKSLDKRGRNAIYTGAAVSLRIPIGAFNDKTAPPATIEIPDGSLAAKREKVVLTPEELKAKRAAQPKPTLAEKVAKAEERAAKLREKLAKGSTTGAGEAAPAQPGM